MDNVKAKTVICQLISLLPIDVHQRLLFDHYTKKLTTMKAIMLFINAQLKQWSSYGEMEIALRAEPKLQQLLQLESISGSQLSRKLDQIPTELLEWMFQHLASQTQQRACHQGQSGKLHIIDSSSIRLPLQLGSWAKMSNKSSGVKMHLRLVVTAPDKLFPDAMIPSSLNVGDRAGAVELVVPSDAIYVMDRGYDDYARMDQWVQDNIQFVIRMRDRALATVIEEYPVPEGSNITRDAKVCVGSSFRSMEHSVRLVEFYDEQERTYRIFTSVWDKTAEEIAQIYKNRWLIELYFKWLKQHLRLKKLHSHKPQAIWNQLFLALITALLVEHIRHSTQTAKTNWQVLRILREYLYRSWRSFRTELDRKPSRSSPGRRPGSGPKALSVRTMVGIIKPSKFKK
ncbi:IS4 family transposase [Paenibacillus macerans]|uniref:IS4 family transposase n=1 Tax=Paenibacillus macerans TaxID=44252 RepID=UPI001F0D29D8|nr:IS4 family transposase [Paenibacillus macerans]UMV50120.1 IS4 family transposase [Paenibacillus macerans]